MGLQIRIALNLFAWDFTALKFGCYTLSGPFFGAFSKEIHFPSHFHFFTKTCTFRFSTYQVSLQTYYFVCTLSSFTVFMCFMALGSSRTQFWNCWKSENTLITIWSVSWTIFVFEKTFFVFWDVTFSLKHVVASKKSNPCFVSHGLRLKKPKIGSFHNFSGSSRARKPTILKMFLAGL